MRENIVRDKKKKAKRKNVENMEKLDSKSRILINSKI